MVNYLLEYFCQVFFGSVSACIFHGGSGFQKQAVTEIRPSILLYMTQIMITHDHYVSVSRQYADQMLFRLDFLGLAVLDLFDGVDLAGTEIRQVGYIDFCAQVFQRGTHHLHFFVHNMDMIQHAVDS